MVLVPAEAGNQAHAGGFLKLPGLLLQAANGHANGYASNGVGRSSSFAMSAQEYRQQHGLLVQGRDVPDPFQTFESAGFGRDILAEV